MFQILFPVIRVSGLCFPCVSVILSLVSLSISLFSFLLLFIWHCHYCSSCLLSFVVFIVFLYEWCLLLAIFVFNSMQLRNGSRIFLEWRFKDPSHPSVPTHPSPPSPLTSFLPLPTPIPTRPPSPLLQALPSPMVRECTCTKYSCISSHKQH